MTPEILNELYKRKEMEDGLHRREIILMLFGVVLLALLILVVMASCDHEVARANEIETIAMVIASESCGEGDLGMYMVANTIANRARMWRKTPYQVVTQKNQYYGLTAPNRKKLYANVKPYTDYLATNIMSLTDRTNGAIYFRQVSEPKFRWCKVETARYLRHIFYR